MLKVYTKALALDFTLTLTALYEGHELPQRADTSEEKREYENSVELLFRQTPSPFPLDPSLNCLNTLIDESDREERASKQKSISSNGDCLPTHGVPASPSL